MTRRRPHVLLLRTPLSPLSSDPYETILGPVSEVQHLPILRTSLLPDPLVSIIAAGPEGHYKGVIVTSSRAVLAWEEAARTAGAEARERWRSTPFFVVGQATSDALHRLPGGSPSEIVLGAEESGTGERLARFIVRRSAEGKGKGKEKEEDDLPFLWLVGDKNRPTIGRILLSEGGITTDRVQIYSTEVRETFTEELEAAWERVSRAEGAEETEVWVTLFSPSGAKDCIPHLRRLGLLPSSSPPSSTFPPTPPVSHPSSPSHLATTIDAPSSAPPPYRNLRLRLAAIGPVTRDYLTDEEGLGEWVRATAVNPDAEDVWKAIEKALGS